MNVIKKSNITLIVNNQKEDFMPKQIYQISREMSEEEILQRISMLTPAKIAAMDYVRRINSARELSATFPF